MSAPPPLHSLAAPRTAADVGNGAVVDPDVPPTADFDAAEFGAGGRPSFPELVRYLRTHPDAQGITTDPDQLRRWALRLKVAAELSNGPVDGSAADPSPVPSAKGQALRSAADTVDLALSALRRAVEHGADRTFLQRAEQLSNDLKRAAAAGRSPVPGGPLRFREAAADMHDSLKELLHISSRLETNVTLSTLFLEGNRGPQSRPLKEAIDLAARRLAVLRARLAELPKDS